MALNIKNRAVEKLAAEVASLAGESKTETIRRALEERKQRLTVRGVRGGKLERVRRLLESRIWPEVPRGVLGGRTTKEERERILGYGPEGV